jgi:dTDP-4-amino-4,6-dideoxygalactose transaminase
MVRGVLESGYLTEGAITHKFESAISTYIGIKHAIATTNCTTALEISLKVMGIGVGDEVLVPDFTYPATAQAVENVGGTPVLVDVDLYTRQITAIEIENGISTKTRCVIPVSLFGYAIELEPIKKLQREHGFYILEDAACSLGVEINGEKVGKQADVSCFSFHPRKLITTGEGGMIVTNNDDWAEQIRMYKKFGMDRKSQYVFYGTNCKLSDILSAVGLAQLEKIDKIIDMRIEKAKIYNELLASIDKITLPPGDGNIRNTYQSYTILLDSALDRDKIMNILRAHGIEAQIGTYALSQLPHFKNTKKIGTLENSHRLYKSLLTLPLHHQLTNEDQEYIVNTIIKAIGS